MNKEEIVLDVELRERIASDLVAKNGYFDPRTADNVYDWVTKTQKVANEEVSKPTQLLVEDKPSYAQQDV